MEQLSDKAQKVQQALVNLGTRIVVQELPASTRTAVEAAAALNCKVAQIAKSIIFQAKPSSNAILVIASGVNRVNENTLAALVGEKIEKASAQFVFDTTGFVIGGVPPLGHLQPIQTFFDEDLLDYDQIWAAAGTPHAVFSIASKELLRILGTNAVKIS